ncbi:MAG: hypothetical protein R3C19_24780 [Planctomycetaceae bacterium]
MPRSRPQPIEPADASNIAAETATEAVAAEAPAAESGHSRPAAKFSGSGGLTVAVWKHKSEDGPDRYSVRLDRSYADSSGEFQNTPYLRDTDLLRAQKLLDEADHWIEHEKSKGRAAAREAHTER